MEKWIRMGQTDRRLGSAKPTMFISFEGIDGAGKTTASLLLVQVLTALGVRACHLSRKRPMFEDRYVAAKADQIRDALWPSTPDEPQYKLGDHFYLWLTAAWLNLIDENLIKPRLSKGRVVVVDGWYYKAAARHSMRPHIRPGLIEECFHPLSRPDLVILLDVPAAEAARRKAVYSNAEAGINDGEPVRSAEGFIAYQERCREALHEVLRREASQLAILDGTMEANAIANAANSLVNQLTRDQAE